MREIEHFKKYEAMMYSILDKYNLIKRKDEYIDLCYIGYTKALKYYDGDKSSFGTFVYRCMEFELLSYLRKEKTNTRKLNNNLLSIEYEYDRGTLEDTLMSENNTEKEIIKQETINELYKAIFKLSIREQYVILNSFKLIHTCTNMNEVYKNLGISRSMGCMVRNKALAKLKRLLQEKQV